MRRHQLGFSIDTDPVIRQRQTDDRLDMQTRCFWITFVNVNKLHRLSVNASIERANVILIPVHIQLRFRAIGIARCGVENLEFFGGNRSVKVLDSVTDAEFLRGVAVGTGTVGRAEIIEIIRITDFGEVNVETPNLVHYPAVVPVIEPAMLVFFGRMLVLKLVIGTQIIKLHDPDARLGQIAEFVLPLGTTLLHIIRRNGSVKVRRNVPVIRQREL